VELCGRLATGLEALLRAGYAINSYAWADTDSDAHTATSHRVTHLRHQFPHLPPHEVIQDWDSRLPIDVRTCSPELLSIKFPKRNDFILASQPVLATHSSNSNKEHTPPGPDISRHITRLVLQLFESQPGGVGYIWNFCEPQLPSANTSSLLGQGTLLDASKCGSGAYRNTRIWQNLLPQETMAAEHARLRPSPRQIKAAMETTWLFKWSAHPSP